MRLWISLHLPSHHLDVCFPRWPTDTPWAAVLQQEKVCACTPAAQAAGVQIGMRRSTVLGLAPQTVLANDDPAARQRHLEGMALALLQYTPDLALFGPHAVVMDVTASLSLFKGPRNLWRRIHATLANMGIRATGGMAPTAQAAWILASQTSFPHRRALKSSTLARRLNILPPQVLPAAQDYLSWLDGIGCHTLGQLRRLPRQGLQQRSNPELMRALDAAYGDAAQIFTWFRAPERFSQRHDCWERLEHTHAVLAVARHLIEQLCGWLQAGQRAAQGFTLALHHETGRHACPPTCIVLRLSQPCWQPQDFSALLAEQLRNLVLTAPVMGVELSLSHASQRMPTGSQLFPEPAQWQREECRLLDLLRARLGDDHVLQPAPIASHLPETANQWMSAGDCPGTEPVDAPRQLPSSRPFWLLPHPIALDTRYDKPVYQGQPLRLLQGPERLESGWWDDRGHQLRDYFVAQAPDATRYWVYRQRGSLDSGWFLQGLFA